MEENIFIKEKEVSLTEIIKKGFNDYNTDDEKGRFADYKKDQRDALIELLECLGLEGQTDIFKKGNHRNSPYVFFKSEVPFIEKLYSDYSSVLLPVRKSDYDKIPDEYAIMLYDNLYAMYARRCSSEESL